MSVWSVSDCAIKGVRDKQECIDADLPLKLLSKQARRTVSSLPLWHSKCTASSLFVSGDDQ